MTVCRVMLCEDLVLVFPMLNSMTSIRTNMTNVSICSAYRALKTSVVTVLFLRSRTSALTRTISMGVLTVFVTRWIAPAIVDLVDILAGLR